MNLTQMEQEVVNYMKDNQGDLDNWFFADEMKLENISKHQLSGVVSSLVKKGIVEHDGHKTAPAIALVEEN